MVGDWLLQSKNEKQRIMNEISKTNTITFEKSKDYE